MRNETKKPEMSSFIEICKPLLSGVPLPCFLMNLEGSLVFSNEAAQEVTGYSRHDEYQRNFVSMLAEEEIGRTIEHINAVLKGDRLSYQTKLKHRNGNLLNVEIQSIPIEINGVILGICGYITEVENEKHHTSQSIPSNWDNIFTGIEICLWSLEATTMKNISISPVCQTIFGYSEEEFLKEPYLWEQLILPVDKKGALRHMELVRKGESSLHEYRIVTKNGDHKWVSDFIVPIFSDYTKEPLRIDRIVVDITKRKKAEEKLTYLAYHDTLTGLPNRRKLDHELHKALTEAKEKKTLVGILFLDLDRFKNINDSLGHKMGDKVLQVIAERLRDSLRYDDLISRQGGDEFVILLKNMTTRADLEEAAARINRIIAEPIKLQGNDYVLSASIGLSIFPDHGIESEGLLQKADHAMYLAKESGGGIRPYEAGMSKSLSRKLLLEQYLHKAIEKNELYLDYQPIVDVYGKQVIGLEALLRWNHPVLGAVSPGEFIEIAEESDLIIKLGNWVLETACKQRKQWLDMKLPPFYVSINVPARQINLESFLGSVKENLERYQLPANLLKIEITERTAMTNVQSTLNTINELQDVGVDIILDDFGVGYSSISYLVQYPFNTIKIDKSFIERLDNKNQRSVCRTLVAMGRNLGMNVVAEGVEEVEQYQFLCSIGCHNMQGYYFSRPAKVELVETFFTPEQRGIQGKFQ
ncbi:EAL domain-containing protein [Bacillus sp. OK048]|uniref:EAL domain-containing protein n=1 Tax=Bacillus sp. OK048 TaxID=1882761 RepID=UPI000881ED89|nr:EAL domain-containing protein [Bacillus sp. OK048]SDM92447.1 PAS domain S-box-containing protein/diguanylate cyclase (GGDEF) domain-containing protein [Bacillus sp. OK048]